VTDEEDIARIQETEQSLHRMFVFILAFLPMMLGAAA